MTPPAHNRPSPFLGAGRARLAVGLPVIVVAAVLCAGAAARPAAAALAPRGRVKALVIFARFLDEGGPATLPAFARDLFDPDLPGSLTHFFEEMSRGQFVLDGQVLPRVYTSRNAAESYLSNGVAGRGSFGRFTREILAAADAEVDFGDFDDDGPDGVPNSGDDDGFVDLLFVVTRSAPAGFIAGDADGVAQLGLDSPYLTGDEAAAGGVIRVRSDQARAPGGTLQRGLNFADAVGIIAHELGHLFGLPDLYDRDMTRAGLPDPELDSAGIGYWGLMGHGARGWEDRGGPTPYCAWSLKQLGWLGRDNEQLVLLEESLASAFLADVNDGGDVYQLPLSDSEYLLVEHRSPEHSFYERRLPAGGVLIWHVDERAADNDDERAKLVDLVTADGLYADAGFPAGRVPDPDLGRDNLDFWSRDGEVRTARGGNLGDATDPFDGVVYTDYSPLSNPATNRVTVDRIRRAGSGFAADLLLDDPRRAGVIRTRETWRDTIEVVGDLAIPEAVRLDIAPGTVVRVGADGRRRGADPERVEWFVAGTLAAPGPERSRVMSAAREPAPGDWAGITVTSTGRLSLSVLDLEHAGDAVVVTDAGQAQFLSRVRIRDGAGSGLRFARAQAGVTLTQVEVEGMVGDGLVAEGGGPVNATGLRVFDNGGHGVVRRDGALRLTGSQVGRNGRTAAGYDLWLREGASGTIAGSRLEGEGEGARLDLTGAVVLEGNTFAGYRVALRTRSSSPRIENNVFETVDTVLSVQGFRIPRRIQLNVVEEPRVLVVNETDQRLDAARNWWGTVQESVIVAGMAGLVDWRPALNFDPRLPVTFELRPNYPNPFNGATVIEFSVSLLEAALDPDALLTLEVRNIVGGLVRRLLQQPAVPGFFRVVWDGRDEVGRPAASGVYTYELTVGRIFLRRRLTLLR